MFGFRLQFLFLLTFSGATLGQEPGAVRVVVPEGGGDAVLPVSIGRNAERLFFDWRKVGPGGEVLQEVFLYDAGLHYNNGFPGQSEQFRGRVSHFPGELKHGNASIIIRKTKASDAGRYSCYFPHLQPRQTFYVELDVAATPKPSVTTLTATADCELLQCEVPGASVNTKAEWQSSTGSILHAEEKRVPEEDHVFITLYVNVTRTDRYQCVVSQEDIKHRVSAQIFVYISDSSSTGIMVGVGIGSFLLGVLTVAAVLCVLVREHCIKRRHSKGSPVGKLIHFYKESIGKIKDVDKTNSSTEGCPLKTNRGSDLEEEEMTDPLSGSDLERTEVDKTNSSTEGCPLKTNPGSDLERTEVDKTNSSTEGCPLKTNPGSDLERTEVDKTNSSTEGCPLKTNPGSDLEEEEMTDLLSESIGKIKDVDKTNSSTEGCPLKTNRGSDLEEEEMTDPLSGSDLEEEEMTDPLSDSDQERTDCENTETALLQNPPSSP
ncbi:butyrophilin subfamily 1 member A1-like isoform X7 [Eleginops maclovinus]|uniref:butyrophilin subfamily 1 member A1-like isoform X7 n=1 Tax=Eleginops maclovinus TaxID=56733 RepID=UPI003080A7AF